MAASAATVAASVIAFASASIVPSAAVTVAAVPVAPSAVLSTAFKALVLHVVGQAFLTDDLRSCPRPPTRGRRRWQSGGAGWARTVRVPAAGSAAFTRACLLHGPSLYLAAWTPLCKGPAVQGPRCRSRPVAQTPSLGPPAAPCVSVQCGMCALARIYSVLYPCLCTLCHTPPS